MTVSSTTERAEAPKSTRATHRSAVTSLVLAILGLTFTVGLTSPFAWVVGRRAIAEIDAAPDQYDGRGLAMAGKILGIVGTVYLAAWLVFALVTGDLFDIDLVNVLRTALNQALGPNAIVYALAAIGLNVHFGYTGLLNFGQAGFMAVGAYGLAVSVATWGLPFGVAVLISLLAPVVLAILLGVPTLRLRADYLAIATIATAEILRLTFGAVETKDVFGGSNGLNSYAGTFQDANIYRQDLFTTGFLAFDDVDLGIMSFGKRDLWSMTVGWIAVAICCLIVWALMRSPWGRVLRSIREDEDAVRSLGKNVFAYKMQALVLGGIFGGMAGLFLALKQASVVPSDYSTNMTFLAFTALLIGGAARVMGPVIGSMILWFLISGLGDFFGQATSGENPLMPTWLMDNTQSSLVRFIVTGLGLMLLMIYRPQGIFGDRREIAIDGR